MADIYLEQAQYFANVPLMQRDIIASVHLEDDDDKTFWDAMLQSRHTGQYKFITYSRSRKGNDTKGCEQCLKYRPYLSKQFFICIDSDMRYLLQKPNFDAANYICQTYTYSWENHYCESSVLKQRFETQCPDKAVTFDFQFFLSTLSKAVYKPLLLLLYCQKNDISDFNLDMFSSCIPKQCQRVELADNGKLLIERIANNFESYLNTPLAKTIDFEVEKNYCNALYVNEQNAYLHIRGHNIFDLVAYIGDLLCRGTSVSFKKDVMMSGLPPQTYWQIKKVAEDINNLL